MVTPAEYFTKTKASQWQALKKLGHSPSRVDALKKIKQNAAEAQGSQTPTPRKGIQS